MELEEVLEQCLGQNFVHMIISNPKKEILPEKWMYAAMRIKERLCFSSPDTRIIRYFILTMQKKRRKLYSFRTRAHLPSDAVLYNGKTVYNIDKQKRENNNKGKKQKE